MRILVWDSGSENLEEFLRLAQRHVDIELFEDLADLFDAQADGDLLVLDLDVERKLAEKGVQRLRKSGADFCLAYLCNSQSSSAMSAKAMVKHQKSKVGGDAYFQFPLDESMLLSLLGPILGEEPGSEFYKIKEEAEGLPSDESKDGFKEESEAETGDGALENIKGPSFELISADELEPESPEAELDSDTIISAHQEVIEEEKDLHEKSLQLDGIFKEALGEVFESERVLQKLEKEEQEEIEKAPAEFQPDFESVPEPGPSLELKELENNLEIKNNEESILDLGEDQEQDEEEPEMSADDDKLDLDLEIVSEDDGLNLDELSAESEENLEAGDLELGALELDSEGSEELGSLELGDASLDLEEASLDLAEDSLDLEEGSLDLGDDDAPALELGSDEELSLDENEEDEENQHGALDLAGEGDELGLEHGLELDDTEDAHIESLDEDADDGAALEFAEDTGISLDIDDLGSESLDVAAEEEESLDLEGDSFELGDDSLELGADSLELGAEDFSLDSESLPESPDFEESSSPQQDDGAMSAHALEQLAEIDKIMAADATTSQDVSHIDDSPLGGGDSDSLAAQISSEDDEPGYDPTKGHDPDSTGIMENPLLNDVEELIAKPTSFEQDHSYDADYGSSPAAQRTISDQRQVLARNDDEFMRLAETIKQLRGDRQALMDRVSELEEKVRSDKKDFSGVQAELDEKKIELSLLNKRRAKQNEEINYRFELNEEKRLLLEEKNRRLEQENEALRKKANVDVNRIRARERELESKLDLLKADTETQLKNRDLKILELKRKIDTLEFDIESIQLKEKKTVDNKYAMEERMDRVINTLRRAIGELESDELPMRNLDKIKKNLDV